MKTDKLVARADKQTIELIEKASELSGLKMSEIIRRGAVAEAMQVLNMYHKTLEQVATNKQEENEVR